MKTCRASLVAACMLLWLIGEMLSGSNPVRASEPIADYWFRETITVGEVDLPDGVSILASDPVDQPRGSLQLENNSETLLYVLPLRNRDVLMMVTPDPNWQARIKLAHEVASYLVAPSRPATLDMQALIDLDPSLVDPNILRTDPPPVDVMVPAPQNSALLLVYGEQVLLVPFTITYGLNTAFDNSVGVNSQAPYPLARDNTAATAQAGWENRLVIGLVAAGALVIAAWIVWRSRAHRR